MKLVSCLAVIGTLFSGIVLSMLIARFYPSTDPLERLYGAIFLSVITSMGLLVYNLSASNWRQILVRSYSWWPLPLFLMIGGWIWSINSLFPSPVV
nr:hypothetical protein [Providencia sp. M-27]